MTACASQSRYAGFSQTPDSDKRSQHYQSKNQHIFISLLAKDLNSEEAERLFQSRKDYIKSLYLNDADPYFGKSVRAPECLQGLNLAGSPQDTKTSKSTEYILPTTEKFVFGICNPKLESFSAKIVYVYCKDSKSFFETKYFKPKDLGDSIAISPKEICDSKK